MKRRIRCLFFLLILFPLYAGARVGFYDLDLSEDNRLLFRAESSGDGAPDQHALFVSRLTDRALQQITAFPEKMELLGAGRTLQIQNVFGAVRVPVSGGLPRSVPGFPSFAAGVPAAGGRTEDLAASPDGRWVLFLETESYAYGNLVLLELASGTKRIVARHVERPGPYFPASWSPDSRVFVYSREGRLYYHTVTSPRDVEEQYRTIGEGEINSVSWLPSGDFFYMRGSFLYRVQGPGLLARTLYADFLEPGSLAGKIPFDFDPSFDFFRVAPDGRSVLICRDGRSLFYCPLEAGDYGSGGPDLNAVLPYVMIPRSVLGLTVLWSSPGLVTVAALVSVGKESAVLAWRLDTAAAEVNFVPLANPPAANAALSPDGTRALLWGGQGVFLYDYVNWRLVERISERPGVSCLWLDNEEFVSGDSGRVEKVNVRGGRSLVCLSAADEFGFEEKGNRIFVKNGGLWYGTDGRSPWTETADPGVRRASLVSGRYRVYLERQFSGPYENLPMIRNTASTGTAPLLTSFQYEREDALPENSPDAVSGIFTHGRRGGLREVALCFDLYDDASGLPGVLAALRRYGIQATFFLNGEFIRRHPGAAREIAEAGHEAASMFFAPVDLSDARYRVAGEFVARGLARNEDEYYRATGREISLFWHPPYYAVSPEIAAAASLAGYRTVGRDVDPLDWVSGGGSGRLSLARYSASEMIERVMKLKRPGSIIPVRLGVLPGGGGYLFLRVEVLLDALIRSGYEMVTVSALLEHSR
ncbi:MAG: polysaccharide deacetylase family protein [Treponema sp.]|jgi:peptidoglycan/xylan/chitin deacetylase (PgdA/CDA1 family)|nr:polysaccharide deacetylase family protein [Treponema sp.]